MTEHGTVRRLLCFGLGYSARVLAGRLVGEGWAVRGTARSPETGAAPPGCRICRFDREHPLPPAAFDGVTHILVSVPPDAAGDPVLAAHADDIAALLRPRVARLSVDDRGLRRSRRRLGGRALRAAPERRARPAARRGRGRVARSVARAGVPVHVFRLAGIYGPGRSPFEALRAGTAKRIDKPGQVFSRIHVEDLASVLAASIARPRPGAVYNVCDDEPAPPEAVVAYAAGLLGDRAAAAGAVRGSRAVADGAQLLGRQQARLERADQDANSASRCAIRPTATGLAAILREEARGLP